VTVNGKSVDGFGGPLPDTEYCIINFYHLVDVPNPDQVVASHKAWLAERGYDIRGRIYYSSQGANCQFGGRTEEALAYVSWLLSQPLWEGVRYSAWPAHTHMYPKLRLKVKPNLISMAGGVGCMPVTRPEARATPLEPAAWKEMIAGAEAKGVVVMDLRNDYEWDAGHFVGAPRPDEEEFAETPVGEGEEDVPSPVRGVDPDTPVMMYCTGGIRCDIYSAFLKAKGFKNLYTLEGGIQHYLRHEGSAHWNGSLYVFDGRMAIGPPGATGADGELATLAAAVDPAAPSGHGLPAAVPCQVCGCAAAELPHVNCANIDCNELFIACASCKSRLAGCCCEACMQAPRLLRPAKTDGGFYGAWGNYAEGDALGTVMSSGRSREGRVARRAKRREAMREKRARQAEERIKTRAMLREAVAKLDSESAPAESESASSLAARLKAAREARAAAQEQQQAPTAA